MPRRPRLPRNHRLFCALALIGLAAPAVVAQPFDRLATIGDSLTDEYDDQSFGTYARNWVELLENQAAIDCGPTAAEAGQPGGTWGEPRRTMFRENWARSGADTTSAIASGQHTGAAGSLARGANHVVVFIGNNDFRPGFPVSDNSNPYNAIYNGFWNQAQIDAHVAQAVANIETVLTPLEAAGQRIVLATAFDFGATPAVRLLFTDPVRRDRVTNALVALRAALRTIAMQRSLVFVDSLAFGQAMFGTNTAPKTTLDVGAVTIQLGQISSATGDPAGFVGDGVHPHTVLQGIIANVFAYALEQPTFSEAQLLAHNGLAYGGSDTLESELGGPISQFVEFYPAAALFADGFETGDLTRWSASQP